MWTSDFDSVVSVAAACAEEEDRGAPCKVGARISVKECSRPLFLAAQRNVVMALSRLENRVVGKFISNATTAATTS